ncbi:MAG: hypothetical protein LBU39_12235 [Desulfobulbaceae bacterium]|nr:hypothetical protein [Desulfobulbaceae bacterium]
MNIIFFSMLALLLAGGIAAQAEEAGQAAVAAQEAYDEDAYGPEAPIIWEKPVKAVVFNHKTHTKDKKLECDACHDSLFEQDTGAAEQKADFTMNTIYDGGYCGACHDGETAFASDTRCTACHIGARGENRLRQAENPAETAPAHH